MDEKKLMHLVLQYILGEIEFMDVRRQVNSEELKFFAEEIRRHGGYKVPMLKKE